MTIIMTNLEVCKLDREGGIRAHSRHDKLDFSRIRSKSKENTDMKTAHCLKQPFDCFSKYLFECPPVSHINANPLHDEVDQSIDFGIKV